MKRLLVFTENYARGGGNRYMVDLVNGVHADFDEVIIAVNRNGVFSDDLRRCSAVKVLTVCFLTRALVASKIANWPPVLQKILLIALLPGEPVLFIINTLLFRSLLARIGSTKVLVCNGGYPASQACIAMLAASRLARQTALMSIVSTPSRPRRMLGCWESLLDRISWFCSARILVNARSIAQSLQMSRSMPENHAQVLYNGLEDPDSFEDVSFKNTRLIVGCVARLDKMKGVFVLLDAFSVLAKSFDSMDLVLAGEGDASQELRRRVDELGLQNRVRFLGHYAGDISALLARFDIYAFPSFWEGLPYSILEAMRSGCAIVATNIGGIPEAIKHQESGLLVAPNDVDSLVAAISTLAVDDEFRKALGERARNVFKKRFSLSVMHANTRKLLMAELNL